MKCAKCNRGREACSYCDGLPKEDWQAICDCGLWDFGAHLVDCESRQGFRWIIAHDQESADVRL